MKTETISYLDWRVQHLTKLENLYREYVRATGDGVSGFDSFCSKEYCKAINPNADTKQVYPKGRWT